MQNYLYIVIIIYCLLNRLNSRRLINRRQFWENTHSTLHNLLYSQTSYILTELSVWESSFCRWIFLIFLWSINIIKFDLKRSFLSFTLWFSYSFSVRTYSIENLITIISWNLFHIFNIYLSCYVIWDVTTITNFLYYFLYTFFLFLFIEAATRHSYKTQYLEM